MTFRFYNLNRWRSIVCLAVVAAMLYWGNAVLRPSLIGWLSTAYWGTCIALSILTVIFGVRDIRRIVRSFRQNRAMRELRANRELNRVRRASIA